MKRIILFLAMLAAAVYSFKAALRDEPEFVRIDEYVVDFELMHLIPLRAEILKSDTEYMAVQALRLISAGHDDNRKIRRLAPEKGMSVMLNGTNAVVDLSSKYFEGIFPNRDTERLFVYQVVNTLTSVDGIDTVSFTIDHEQRKRLAGYVDMREVFEPDRLV